MADSQYRPVAQADTAVGDVAPTSRGSTLQWLCLALLTFTAGALLARRLPKVQLLMTPTILPASNAPDSGSTNASSGSQSGVRRRRRWSYPMSMGRMGTSSSFVLRTKPRRIKQQAAKAATRSVVLIGSHFALGNDLLTRVFGELCQHSRLSLRCEATWGGPHDLKALAAFKGRKNRRIVWLERDAGRLQRTLRGVRTHASDFRLVHLVWDPLRACTAMWHTAVQTNSSLSTLCDQLSMERLPVLYKRAKRDKARMLQLRLEELVSRKPTAAAAWQQLASFLGLPEARAAELSSIGSRAVTELGLRARVLNRGSPAWVQQDIVRNTTLHAKLRKLRRELEYGSLPRGMKTTSAIAGETVPPTQNL
jgi:hypothetical protein